MKFVVEWSTPWADHERGGVMRRSGEGGVPAAASVHTLGVRRQNRRADAANSASVAAAANSSHSISRSRRLCELIERIADRSKLDIAIPG